MTCYQCGRPMGKWTVKMKQWELCSTACMIAFMETDEWESNSKAYTPSTAAVKPALLKPFAARGMESNLHEKKPWRWCLVTANGERPGEDVCIAKFSNGHAWVTSGARMWKEKCADLDRSQHWPAFAPTPRMWPPTQWEETFWEAGLQFCPYLYSDPGACEGEYQYQVERRERHEAKQVPYQMRQAADRPFDAAERKQREEVDRSGLPEGPPRGRSNILAKTSRRK